MEESALKPNWLDLPEHLLSLIFDKLTSLGDVFRFGAVCVCLQSLSIEKKKFLLFPVSLSMITSMCADDAYKISEEKGCDFQLIIPQNHSVCGSSYGWFVHQEYCERRCKVRLFNPFLSLNNEIQIAHILNDYLQKAALSANPSRSSDFAVMGIRWVNHLDLLFCRAGDKAWSNIVPQAGLSLHDVIYYKGMFHAVNGEGTVVAINISTPQPREILVGRHIPPLSQVSSWHWFTTTTKFNLVEISKELLQVIKISSDAFLLNSLFSSSNQLGKLGFSCTIYPAMLYSLATFFLPFRSPHWISLVSSLAVSTLLVFQKAALSVKPSHFSDFALMGIRWGYKLAFCRAGDKAWSYFKPQAGLELRDVIYYESMFHAINVSGNVEAIDIHPSKPKEILIVPPLRQESSHYANVNLVETSKELLQVIKIFKERFFDKFIVLKLESVAKTSEQLIWVRYNPQHQ
ncbi:hypothetical protein GIB67_040270 [Kingdonia uniflora]|uniref:KIB1-4 beta-propeller domain-containing protein n=1 Tax=Kingdonia uniflora TaxID=39325 RepID=A0A7J7MV64_9MAGN|nr:hypothetical protein GIB67_040270 [Kingdonia uniflora]